MHMYYKDRTKKCAKIPHIAKKHATKVAKMLSANINKYWSHKLQKP